MGNMNYNPFSLEGKAILITGASSGIDQSTAIECSKMGAKVIISGRNEERLQQTFSQLDGTGHLKIVADLTVKENIDKLAIMTPNLDGLVNNVGIIRIKPIQFVEEGDLENMLQTNTFAPIALTRYLYKKKKINKNASIVFTSSIEGVFKVSLGNAMYSVSKGAIDTFMRSAAIEFARKGIRCNSVNPGMIDTPLINQEALTEEYRKQELARYPLKRYGQSKEIAWGIIYLLSNASNWVTGINLKIDGGITL